MNKPTDNKNQAKKQVNRLIERKQKETAAQEDTNRRRTDSQLRMIFFLSFLLFCLSNTNKTIFFPSSWSRDEDDGCQMDDEDENDDEDDDNDDEDDGCQR